MRRRVRVSAMRFNLSGLLGSCMYACSTYFPKPSTRSLRESLSVVLGNKEDNFREQVGVSMQILLVLPHDSGYFRI